MVGLGRGWPGAGLAASFMCCFLLLQAWAVFKGKFKEGDKAEPATWKTRLRCALNKSPDFEEVTDRSQLDISEPYKVYRIVPEEEQKCNYPGQARGPAEAARPTPPPTPAGEPGSWVGGRLGERLRLSPPSSGLCQQILRALPLDLGHCPLAKWPFPLGGRQHPWEERVGRSGSLCSPPSARERTVGPPWGTVTGPGRGERPGQREGAVPSVF